MAFGKKTAIVSIAVLVMIVAMAEVDARTSEGDFGRSLLTSSQASSRDIKVDERRNLYNIVGSKACCNSIVHTCCAPAPAPKPSRKASTPKASTSGTSKASAPKASTSKTPKAPAPKSSKAPAPKSSKAPAPKTSTSKSPRAPTPKRSASKTPKAPAPAPSVLSKIMPKGIANAPMVKKSP